MMKTDKWQRGMVSLPYEGVCYLCCGKNPDGNLVFMALDPTERTRVEPDDLEPDLSDPACWGRLLDQVIAAWGGAPVEVSTGLSLNGQRLSNPCEVRVYVQTTLYWAAPTLGEALRDALKDAPQ